MKRTVIAENLLLVVIVLVITWVITAFLFQNVLIESKLGELKNVLSLAQQSNDPQRLAGGSGKLSVQIELIAADNLNTANLKEVQQAQKSGYGERADSYGILSDCTVAVAGKLANGAVLRVWDVVPGSGYTLWSTLVSLLVAVAVIVHNATRLVTDIDFVFKGAAITLERAGNEGGVPVNPAPETLQYVDFLDSAHELARISTQVSQRVKELFVENKRIDYLLNNMNEGLIVFDRAMRILVINRSASRFFGASGEMKGQNVLRLTHMPVIADSLSGVTQSGVPTALDVKNPDGKKTLQILMSPVHDEEENIDGAIMLISDVTEIRLAEQIRSEFVANASHELKTPLTSIKGFSELIDSGIISDPEKAHGYLEHIRTETERMIGLIGDILKLSELEATSHDTGMVQVSMKMLAQRVCDSLYNQIHVKDVAVRVTGDIGSIKANPDHMEQMLLNLVDNAIKYNRPGGSVEVAVTQDTDVVSVKVSDTGVGIPKESQQRVFERFYRVDKSRSRKLGGTGLGLSIVKHIVELYSGKIALTSEPGQGTSIEIKLPLENEEE